MINAYNADKNRVFPPVRLSIAADKRIQHCHHRKPNANAGSSVYGYKKGGVPVFYRENLKEYIYIYVVINTKSPYPCGFPTGITPVGIVGAVVRGSNAN